MNKIFLKKNILFLLVVLVIISFTRPIFSETSSDELLQQIQEQEQLLQETRASIQDLESKIQTNQEAIDNAKEGLPKLTAELDNLTYELELNQKNLDLVYQENEYAKIVLKQLNEEQVGAIKSIYKRWRLEVNDPILKFEDPKVNILISHFEDKVIGSTRIDIGNAEDKIIDLEANITKFDSLIQSLEAKKVEIETKKVAIEQQINQLNSVIAGNVNQVSQLYTQEESLQSLIKDLNVEQQAAAKREADLLKLNQGSIPVPSEIKEKLKQIEGGFYFSGIGRDVSQGHGVGLSQFGAYGGANAGMSAEQIIKFYYTGVNLTQSTGTVSVIGGPQNINVEEYLVHLGEVPDKACGTEAQVQDNPEKYALANPNSIWVCWPEEAIKAQIIIARTYALKHVSLYPDARSQVYDLKYNKQWAQEETAGIVITYNGAIIDALYSSDNSQGNGTANNDTIFQNFYGDGTPYPYLRSVNDSAFARQTQWTHWTYQTDVYTMDSIMQMFDDLSNPNDVNYNQDVKANIKALRDSLGGGIASVQFERDASQRVKKVFFVGLNGARNSLGGWWFKNMWNTWTNQQGRGDFIYSQTFYINFD